VRRVGLRPFESFYFNYLLFAPIWLARRAIRYARIDLRSEGEVNTQTLNFILKGIFTADVWTAPRLRPPFGVSILVLAEKPALFAGEPSVDSPATGAQSVRASDIPQATALSHPRPERVPE
jgi:hypothetical protein